MTEKQKNDVLYVCSLIETIARKTKNHRQDVIRHFTKAGIERQLRLAEVNHCLSFEQVSDELIEDLNIPDGDFDTAAECRYTVPSATSIRCTDNAIHIWAAHQLLQDTKLLFGGRRHQILPPFRQDGQICDAPLDVFGIVDIGRSKLHQMTHAPAYQITVALKVAVLTVGGTEDFGVGHGNRGLFCYN